MQPTKIRDHMIGKWPGLLSHFGMQHKQLSGKHTSCPLCNDGRDRFRFDNKGGRGTYFCSQCGSGDGFMLLQEWKGWDFATAAEEIERVIGVIQHSAVKSGISQGRARELIERIWRESVSVGEGDEVWTYLHNRGLSLMERPRSIRLHPGLEYRDGDKVIGKFPAMVSAVSSPDGRVITLHRTYLQDGAKAPVEKAKKLMPVSDDVSINGCAIRLYGSEVVLGIAEGIETALAASEMYGMPVWSVVSANGMETFEPHTDTIKRVVIFADNDENFAGQKAAYTLANKLSRKKIRVDVMVPPVVGQDWLDVLNSRSNNFFRQ